MLLSCSEDGIVAVWNIERYELLKHFEVCSFLKGISFCETNKVRVWGSNNIVYECLINDGQKMNPLELNGSTINSLVECFIE